MKIDNNAEVYNINKEYRIVSLKGNKCSLFFKNKQNVLRATLEGCDKILSNIMVDSEKDLSALEKGYLLSFIRAKKYALTKETADVLGVSIIKYDDGREEYVSAKILLKRIAAGIDFAKVYVNNLKIYQLNIPPECRNVSYNLAKADIVKLVVGENCNANIDCRDNEFIESLVIKDKFSGAVNLSRTTIESVFIGNNCRCNLTLSDSRKCPNLQIADVYSGNINIVNSCLYAFSLGYYSYADIMLSNNVIKKEIAIGDAFCGGLYAINQSCENFKMGNDCKGWVKINNQTPSSGIVNLNVGSEFSGNINLSGDNSVKNIICGDKNSGKIIASYATALERVNIGHYFNGNLDLSASTVQNVYFAYGASGRLVVTACSSLKMVQAGVDNDLYIEGEIKSIDSFSDNNRISYYFEDVKSGWQRLPLYKRIYQSFAKRT